MEEDALSCVTFDELSHLLRSATHRVRLASPFITYPVAKEVAAIARHSGARWTLLTALTPASVANGFLSTAGLKALIEAGVDVRSSKHLHAKAYLADRRGLLGSANLTRTGLGLVPSSNLELMVDLSAEQLASAAHSLDAWWRVASRVGPGELAAAKAAARRLPVTVAPPVIEDPEADDALAVGALLAEAREVGLWVKAVYGDDDSGGWEDGALIASSKKGRPKFAIGDLALIYLRDHGVCNAVVEITSDPWNEPGELAERQIPPAEAARWPWANDVRGRLWVPMAAGVAPDDFGIDRRGLQNGHVRIDLAEFAAAVRSLSAAQDHADSTTVL